MKIFNRLIILFVLLGLQGCSPGSLSQAALYRLDGQYAKADEIYKAHAERGNPIAQYNLGDSYENGVGISRNVTEAAKWYRLAAEQGHSGAQDALGRLYENGLGVTLDFGEAMKWYSLAAAQKNLLAQYHVGLMYAHGRGVIRNQTEATKWLKMAADQHNYAAQIELTMVEIPGRKYRLMATEVWQNLVTQYHIQKSYYTANPENDDTFECIEPSNSGNGVFPAACVSWNDAKTFIAWLNKTYKPIKPFRLPSREEWEFAAQGGVYGIGSHDSFEQGGANCEEETCKDGYEYASPLKSFKANPFGLYDMEGNVAEWVDYCPDKTCYVRIAMGSSWEGWGGNWEEVFNGDSRKKWVGFRLAQDM